MRSGGRKRKSKSAVCNAAALCNLLYKTSFLDNTISFTSPHDHPQGTFRERQPRSSTTTWPTWRTAGSSFPTRRPLAIGEAVVVAIRLGQRRSPMLLRGQRRLAPPRQAQHEDQGRHRHRVPAHRGADARLPAGASRAATRPRWSPAATSGCPSSCPVTWQVPGALQDNVGVLRDIGRGGAFVRPTEPLPHGRRRRAEGFAAGRRGGDAAVGARRWKGHPGGEHGFGVEWKARDAGGTRRIKELVRRIEACGAIGASTRPLAQADDPLATGQTLRGRARRARRRSTGRRGAARRGVERRRGADAVAGVEDLQQLARRAVDDEQAGAAAREHQVAARRPSGGVRSPASVSPWRQTTCPSGSAACSPWRGAAK